MWWCARRNRVLTASGLGLPAEPAEACAIGIDLVPDKIRDGDPVSLVLRFTTSNPSQIFHNRALSALNCIQNHGGALSSNFNLVCAALSGVGSVAELLSLIGDATGRVRERNLTLRQATRATSQLQPTALPCYF